MIEKVFNARRLHAITSARPGPICAATNRSGSQAVSGGAVVRYGQPRTGEHSIQGAVRHVTSGGFQAGTASAVSEPPGSTEDPAQRDAASGTRHIMAGAEAAVR
jgi:hypothetical protein